MSFRIWLVENQNTEESAFYNALASNPKDKLTWNALADWLEERKDQKSVLIRELVNNRKPDYIRLDPLWRQYNNYTNNIPNRATLGYLLGYVNKIAQISWKLSSSETINLEKAADIDRLMKSLSNVRLPEVRGVMELINNIMNGYGVEAMNNQTNYIILLYINRGDPYDTTIFWNDPKERFEIGSWGDWVEKNGAKYGVL